MAPAPPEVITRQVTALRRLMVSGAEATNRIAIRPVFVDDAGRRRRLITGFGYLAALACIGYIAIVGISLTAGPTGPLATTPDPKPPGLVKAVLPPTPVRIAPTTTSATRPQATPAAIPTSAPRPRLVRPAPPRSAPARPVAVPPTTPSTSSAVPTTPAVPPGMPCTHRHGCGSTSRPRPRPPTDTETAAPAQRSAPDRGSEQ